MTKQTIIYFDANLYKFLKRKAGKTSRSVSDLVNEAVRHELAEDQEDLQIFNDRINEPTISFKQMLKKLLI